MRTEKTPGPPKIAPDESGEETELGDEFAYRDVNERLPNEALREELDSMTDKEKEDYLKRLEGLARTYIGPGGP